MVRVFPSMTIIRIPVSRMFVMLNKMIEKVML